jgi:endonuclease I
MKTLATLIFVISSPLFADSSVQQYYSSVKGLKGYKLKTGLKKILKNSHMDRGYGALINVYFKSDTDKTYDKDGSLVDMYSEDPNYKDDYGYKSKSQVCGSYRGESDCFNREHLVPQSSFNKRQPMRNDFFHVYPSDGYVNGRRSNHPFGEVDRPTWESRNGSKLGSNTYGGFRGTVFEPIDEFKGDIARALLYFAVRYEDRVESFNHKMFDGSKNQVFASWFLAMLFKWHKMDPVSKHEVHRNNIGFKFQGNRNPFIDHPEWVTKIWGSR